jgi:hypothetical protein
MNSEAGWSRDFVGPRRKRYPEPTEEEAKLPWQKPAIRPGQEEPQLAALGFNGRHTANKSFRFGHVIQVLIAIATLP